MLDDLDSAHSISGLTEGLLGRADAIDRWPTPVDDIVAAARLEEPAESPFDASVLARAPKYLRKAVALLGSRKIRAILDRRERAVFLDPSIEHEGRRSFLRLHEVSHHLFPWQQELAYADTDLTLSSSARALFEREANQGAAELLFQGPRFAAIADEYRVGMAAVSELSGIVGASLQSTLRRYAETHRAAVCGMVLDPSPVSRDPLRYRRREVSQSPTWSARFGRTWPPILSDDAFPFLSVIEPASFSWAPNTVSWPDLRSEPIEIHVDSISNRFGHLLLLWVPRNETFKRRRKLVVEGQTT